MRPLRRILAWAFGLAAAACALPLLVLVAAWAVSWRAVPQADVTFYSALVHLSVARGSLFIWEESGDAEGGILVEAMERSEALLSVGLARDPDDEVPPAADRVLGFGLTSEVRVDDPQEGGMKRVHRAVVPAWAVAGPLAVLPAIWLGRRLAKRRRDRGRPRVKVPRRPFRARALRAATLVSTLLLAASAGAWLQVSRWHDYLLQWQRVPPGQPPKPERRWGMRADALQGAVVLFVDRRERIVAWDDSSLDWRRSWWRPDWRGHHPPEPHPLPGFDKTDLYTEPEQHLFATAGLPSPATPTGHEWQVPFWFLILLSAPLPAARAGRWVTRLAGRRRYAAGMCQGCGYDLRASLERCPECGRAVPAADSRTADPAHMN